MRFGKSIFNGYGRSLLFRFVPVLGLATMVTGCAASFGVSVSSVSSGSSSVSSGSEARSYPPGDYISAPKNIPNIPVNTTVGHIDDLPNGFQRVFAQARTKDLYVEAKFDMPAVPKEDEYHGEGTIHDLRDGSIITVVVEGRQNANGQSDVKRVTASLPNGKKVVARHGDALFQEGVSLKNIVQQYREDCLRQSYQQQQRRPQNKPQPPQWYKEKDRRSQNGRSYQMAMAALRQGRAYG